MQKVCDLPLANESHWHSLNVSHINNIDNTFFSNISHSTPIEHACVVHFRKKNTKTNDDQPQQHHNKHTRNNLCELCRLIDWFESQKQTQSINQSINRWITRLPINQPNQTINRSEYLKNGRNRSSNFTHSCFSVQVQKSRFFSSGLKKVKKNGVHGFLSSNKPRMTNSKNENFSTPSTTYTACMLGFLYGELVLWCVVSHARSQRTNAYTLQNADRMKEWQTHKQTRPRRVRGRERVFIRAVGEPKPEISSPKLVDKSGPCRSLCGTLQFFDHSVRDWIEGGPPEYTVDTFYSLIRRRRRRQNRKEKTRVFFFSRRDFLCEEPPHVMWRCCRVEESFC